MSENYTHWIGLVPAGPPRAKASARGAALAVVDVHGRLSTLATVRVPYAERRCDGFETLSMLLSGDWEGLRGGEWRPLVVLDRFSPTVVGNEREVAKIRVFTAGLLLGYLQAHGAPYVELARRLWVDASIVGSGHPGRGGSREQACADAAAERWSRFRNAKAEDIHHAEAALLADVGRQRFRSSEAVA